MIEEGIKLFGAFGIALTLCVTAIGWLVKRLSECDKRNHLLTDKIIELAKMQSTDLERNTSALLALKDARNADRESRAAETNNIVAAIKELRSVLKWGADS